MHETTGGTLEALIDALEGLRARDEVPDDLALAQAFGVPASEVARCRGAIAALAGDDARRTPGRLGDYELRGVLGRGGMGVVHRAWHPRLAREVAIKLVDRPRAGADERFAVEARAAARLRHPHIVPIHDVGQHDGRPFIVMELIDGEPLAVRVRRAPLEPVAAAIIAAKLARALQSAHEGLILHRDVKPHNVLMTRDGEPLLVDFGLAKDLAAAEDITESGLLLGTPAYMAPEQARGEGDAVDRRTDVYGLGATLHEMLTGRPPFEADTREALLRRIEHDPPPRLRVEPDLETICLTCLAKEPERRYATASALAADLERWLRGEAICARRPGLGERLRRWSRRNSALTRALAIAAPLVLVASAAATSAFVARLTQERDAAAAARLLADESVQEARRQEERAGDQAALAQRRAESARRSLDLLVDEVHDALADAPGAQVRAARERLLGLALRELEELRRERPTGSPTPLDVAAALREVQLARVVGEARRIHAATTRAVRMARAQVAAAPHDPSARGRLALALQHLAQGKETGDRRAALAATSEAIAWARAAGPAADPRNLIGALTELSDLLLDAGQPSQASAPAAEALAVARGMDSEDPAGRAALLTGLLACARVDAARGDAGAALERYEELVARARRALAQAPGRTALTALLAKGLLGVAKAFRARGDLAGGEALLLEAVSLTRRLVEEDPTNPGLRSALVDALLSLSDALADGGHPDRASPLLEQATDVARDLLAERAGAATERAALCRILWRLGRLHGQQGDRAAAGRRLEEALSLAREAVGSAAHVAVDASLLAETLFEVGRLRLQTDELAAARAALEEASATYRLLGEADRSNLAACSNEAVALMLLGNLAGRENDHATARARWAEAAALLRALPAGDAPGRRNLIRCLHALARAAVDRRDLDAAAAHLVEAVTHQRALATGLAADARLLGELEAKLAWVERARGVAAGRVRPVDAGDWLRLAEAAQGRGEHAQAVEACERLLERVDAPTRRALILDGVVYNAACSATLAGRRAQALAWLREDMTLRRHLLSDARERARQERHLEWARAGDPDLASLRGDPSFEALFGP